MAIAGALLSGQTTPNQIAAYVNCSEGRVSRYLENPVSMRWISDTVSEHIGSRLGIVSAALFARAAQGDVTAARLLYEKFGALVSRSQHTILNCQGPSLQAMSDADLSLLVADKARQLGEKDIIEAKFEIKEEQDDSGGDKSVPAATVR